MAENRPGGEPTEEPTPRRLRQAREKGQIARSVDLTGAASFAAAFGALVAGGFALGQELAAAMRSGITRAAGGHLATVGPALEEGLDRVLLLTLPILGAAFVASAVVGYLQAGGLFTLKTLVPDFKKVNPLEGAKRIFSRRTLVELVKSVVKMVAIGGIAWLTIEPTLAEIPRLAGAPAPLALEWTGHVATALGLRVAVAFAVIGAADYLWQRHQLRKDLMMTREEVKREYKETEGDPQHKAERQRLHRELLQHQMVESVRSADCVIVNPEHIAVALRFDEETMGAPQVVAKGERLVAQQIKEVARRYGVPIYRDVALARALNQLELGDEIPEELYEAVAEVLRFAYRQAGKDLDEDTAGKTE